MSELADFHPGTGHLHNCRKTTVGSDAPCTDDCINDLYAVAQDLERQAANVEKIDRNARAYGWEVGRGHLMVDHIEDCDPANPFLDPNWRDHVQVRNDD